MTSQAFLHRAAARILKLRKGVKPKAARFTRLTKLFVASVGPFVARERCQATI